VIKIEIFAFCLILVAVSASGSDIGKKSHLPDSVTRAPDNWFNLDLKMNGVFGVSTEKAYAQLLKGRKHGKVVVAILDSGVDTDHEDLSASIWTNSDEIPGNGIDDDKNGYVDDIHGWDFIGGPDSTFVSNDTWELTREYVKYSEKYELNNGENLNNDSDDYSYYRKLKDDFEKQLQENKEGLENLQHLRDKISRSEALLKEYLKTDTIRAADIASLNAGIDSIDEAAWFMNKVLSGKLTSGMLDEGLKYYRVNLDYKLNRDFDPRYIVGDNYADFSEKYYGNNLVKGSDPYHGTHAGGIISAARDNGIGIKGVCGDVELMVVRMLPSGDERDKDVANAVYYAVDNGARIISMSFGKDYSPGKKYVDDAFRYAADHGVLLVHAAGNDSRNTDEQPSYPSPKYLDGSGECSTWIEVGAVNWKDGKDLAAGFTNYGKNTVDIFAPGVDLYSTVPGSSYKNASGTSMAAPVVAGVAALVLVYHPELTALQLKKILLDSAVSCKRQKVKKPGNPDENIRFGRLSRTGGVVNAYTAIRMADRVR
jgi:subtilisin family serine protease